MAHSSSVFSRMPIELPNRSGFDMSHENLGTATCGTLVPVLVDELLPNDTISLGASFQVQLPPMATDFYGRVDYVLEAFFVPSRLLWGGWESFMTHPTASPQYPSGTPVEGKSKYLPQLTLPAGNVVINGQSVAGPGSLSDYLGYKADDVSYNTRVSLLPYLAYHRIWDDWYRDSRIQSPLFFRPDASSGFPEVQFKVPFKPFVSGGQLSAEVIDALSDDALFFDGVSVTNLRQRNWAKDYFNTASTLPQAGNASILEFDVNDDGVGNFSIAALRSANSLQKWLERNNIAGYRYSDQIFAQYGIYPSDAIMDRCIYLGRTSQNVYTRSVFMTTPNQNSSNNPFKSTGAKFGSSQVIGEGSLVDHIRVTEHGFLMVLASLVPHAYYSTGRRRYLTRKVVGDIAFPLLSGMGDQAIYKTELFSGAVEGDVFGYTDLYAEYKYHDDEVHGLLRDGSSLESFALQRSFDSAPELGTDFLQIPIDFLKQVMSYGGDDTSNFDCWYDIYFPYKKVSTLPEYSLPTLADLKNTHTKFISRGGKRL